MNYPWKTYISNRTSEPTSWGLIPQASQPTWNVIQISDHGLQGLALVWFLQQMLPSSPPIKLEPREILTSQGTAFAFLPSWNSHNVLGL